MAELKTRENTASVAAFLNAIEDEQQRADCKVLSKMMRDATGKPPKMWGTAIVGFDKYDYRYESGRSGSWPITGFSPRAQNISVYIMPGFSKCDALLEKLGKHQTGKSCLYIKKLADVDDKVLSKLITSSVKEMRRKYPSGAGK
jgi:hypothetical protein